MQGHIGLRELIRLRADSQKKYNLVSELSELRHEIVEYDEILTHSALMVALTNQDTWKDRYRHAEKELGKALDRAFSIGGLENLQEVIKVTNLANDIPDGE